MPIVTLNGLQIVERQLLRSPAWCRSVHYTEAQVMEEKRLFQLWDEVFDRCVVIYDFMLILGFDSRTSETVRRAYDGPLRELADRRVGGRLPRLTQLQARVLESAAAKWQGPWLWSDPVVSRKIGLDQEARERVFERWIALFKFYLDENKAWEASSETRGSYWLRRLTCDLPMQRVARYRHELEADLLDSLTSQQRSRWNAMLQG